MAEQEFGGDFEELRSNGNVVIITFIVKEFYLYYEKGYCGNVRLFYT